MPFYKWDVKLWPNPSQSRNQSLTFLLGLDSVFETADGSKTGLVFRLFENFLRLRLSAAKAPNPLKRISNKNTNMHELNHYDIYTQIECIYDKFCKENACMLFTRHKYTVFFFKENSWAIFFGVRINRC